MCLPNLQSLFVSMWMFCSRVNEVCILWTKRTSHACTFMQEQRTSLSCQFMPAILKHQFKELSEMTVNYHSPSPTAMLRQLGWSDLTEQRRKARLVMTYKIKHGLAAIPVIALLLQVGWHGTTIIKRLVLPGLPMTPLRNPFLGKLHSTGMPSVRTLLMPHHWRHL